MNETSRFSQLVTTDDAEYCKMNLHFNIVDVACLTRAK